MSYCFPPANLAKINELNNTGWAWLWEISSRVVGSHVDWEVFGNTSQNLNASYDWIRS